MSLISEIKHQLGESRPGAVEAPGRQSAKLRSLWLTFPLALHYKQKVALRASRHDLAQDHDRVTAQSRSAVEIIRAAPTPLW
jgi:hypothetical protein